MAVNESRNLNRDLIFGATDGLVKKAAPDRGGVVEDHPTDRNLDLHRDLYDTVSSIEGKTYAERVSRSLGMPLGPGLGDRV